MRIFLALSLAITVTTHAAVTLEWVTVGDIGNAADPLTGYGAVSYEYGIMKYEVTNAQYCEFLNAKAASDPSSLYNPSMTTDARGGIIRSGTSGSYTYSVKSGYENMPVIFVSHLDAQRFANWIHNGQGTGDTETGAYTVGSLAVHGTLANVWIPTENEWYKAAYYQPAAAGGPSDSYWLYPTQSDTKPVSASAPSVITGAANFYYNDGVANGINGGWAATQSTTYVNTTNYLSNVGAYSNSSTYYGTFDQGGNVKEWNEAVVGASRGYRGGSWGSTAIMNDILESSGRFSVSGSAEENTLGFRLATVPEPSRVLLLFGSGCGLLLRRRRLQSR